MPIAETYLKIGANEEGVDVLRKMVENERQYLDYYFDNSDQLSLFGNRPQQSIGIIGQSALLVSQQFPQSKEVADEFNQIYQEYAGIYQSLGN